MINLHLRDSGRRTGPCGTFDGPRNTIYICLHCGDEQYISSTDGLWIYNCHNRYYDFSGSCCYRLKCKEKGLLIYHPGKCFGC
jgi:hypothetical protein